MAAPEMPKDANLVALQTAGLADGRTLAVSGSSARKELPEGATVVLLVATDAMHLKFGDGTVEVATTDGDWDMYLAAGAQASPAIKPGQTHVAAIGGGDLKIMAYV